MTDATVPAHLDPRVGEFLAATDRLTGPGSPFELVTEDVLGEPMQVFAQRPARLREVLAGSAVHGDRLAMAFSDGRRDHLRAVQPAGRLHRRLAARRPRRRLRATTSPSAGPTAAGWILSFWATLSLGAVVVAMNGWWTDDRDAPRPRAHRAEGGDGRRQAGPNACRPRPAPPRSSTSMPTSPRCSATPPTPRCPTPPIAEDDPAMLIFTSGTTGRAKAAVLSHRSIIAYSMLQNFIGARGMVLAGRGPSGGPPPVRLAVFPLFHVSGLGATVNSIHDRLHDGVAPRPLRRRHRDRPHRALRHQRVGRHRHPRRAPARAPRPRRHRSRLSSWCRSAWAARPPRPTSSAGSTRPSRTSPARCRPGYGSTETGALVLVRPQLDAGGRRPTASARPCPTVDVRITGADGRGPARRRGGRDLGAQPAAHERLLAQRRPPTPRPSTTAAGSTPATSAASRAGVLHIASRKRDLIIRGGENIYPFEIENRLDEHDHIVEAAVIGVDHHVLGQEVKAIVVVTADSRAHRGRRAGPLRRDARVVQGADPRRDPHRAAARATRAARC